MKTQSPEMKIGKVEKPSPRLEKWKSIGKLEKWKSGKVEAAIGKVEKWKGDGVNGKVES